MRASNQRLEIPALAPIFVLPRASKARPESQCRHPLFSPISDPGRPAPTVQPCRAGPGGAPRRRAPPQAAPPRAAAVSLVAAPAPPGAPPPAAPAAPATEPSAASFPAPAFSAPPSPPVPAEATHPAPVPAPMPSPPPSPPPPSAPPFSSLIGSSSLFAGTLNNCTNGVPATGAAVALSSVTIPRYLGLAFDWRRGLLYALFGNANSPPLDPLPVSGFAIYRINTTSGTIALFAGSPTITGSTDGQGTAARFQGVTDIALHQSSGDLFVAQGYSCAIRRVTLNSTVTSPIGGGTFFCSGFKDGFGTSAGLNTDPHRIAVTSDGAIYYAAAKKFFRISPAVNGFFHTVFAGGNPVAGPPGFILAANARRARSTSA